MIHYKFKGTNTWDRLSSDNGPFSVLELKREIIKHKRLGNADFDLVITDAQSGASYMQDGYLIPRNAAVIVRRVPTTKQKALILRAPDEPTADARTQKEPEVNGDEVDEFGDSIYKDKEEETPTKEQEEEAKMLNVLNKAAQYKSFGNRSTTFGSTTNEGAGGMDEFRRKTPKVGGRNEFAGAGGGGDRSNRTPPSHYICNRCNKPGHFIRFCPTNGDDDFNSKRPKHATGIPRSFLKPIAPEEAQRDLDPVEEEEKERSGGTVMLEAEKDGQKVSEFFLARPNNYEFQKFYGKDGRREERGKKRSQGSNATSSPSATLLCSLCGGLFRDAVAVPCCFSSFCDECIRQELVISSSSCPMCNLGASPEELLLNRGLRRLVDDYNRSHPDTSEADISSRGSHNESYFSGGSNNKNFRGFVPA